MRRSVTVFCASQPTGEHAEHYLKMARDFGRLLAEAGFICVNGGGGGMMQALSEGAHAAGGEVRLVCLTKFPPPHECYDTCLNEDLLRDRQHLLIAMGDAYVALPGGLGTALEVLDVASRMVLGELPGKPPVTCVSLEDWKCFRWHLEYTIDRGLIHGNATDEIRFAPNNAGTIALLKGDFS